MTRWTGLAIGAAAAALAGGWLVASVPTRQAPSKSPGAQVVAGSLDDLLMDLQVVPLDGRTPPPFALESLDGRRVTLADLAGRPALLYFWATW
jgi:hypothetical protein